MTSDQNLNNQTTQASQVHKSVAAGDQSTQTAAVDPGLHGMKLTNLHRGCVGVISSFTADSQDVNRLKAMGICVGRKVQLIKHGDPLIVLVLGTRLGISARLATEIVVLACDFQSSASRDAGKGVS